MKASLILLIAAFIALGSSLLAQGNAAMPFYPALLKLPVNTEMSVDWVLAPMESGSVEKLTADEWGNSQGIQAFEVDAKGNPLFLFRDDLILSPLQRQLTQLSLPEIPNERDIRAIVALESGATFYASNTELLFCPFYPQADSGHIVLELQPLALLPSPGSRVCKGSGDNLYFISTEAESGQYSVFLLKPERLRPDGPLIPLGYRRIFSSPSPITAVTGDGETTWLAMGNVIFKLAGGKAPEPLPFRPAQAIHTLYPNTNGVLYVTSSEFGYANADGNLNICGAAGNFLSFQGKDAYWMDPHTLAVIKIARLDELSKVPLAWEENRKGEVAAARIADLKLYATTAPAFKPGIDARTFPTESTQFVALDLKLENLGKGTKHIHEINVHWKRIEGGISFWSYAQGLVFEAGTASLPAGFSCGDKRAGNLLPGTYKAEIYLDGIEIQTVEFVISGKTDPYYDVFGKDNAGLQQWLTDGGSPDYAAAETPSLLHWAVMSGNPEAVKILLDAGANPNIVDKESGNTPIFRISRNNGLAIAKLLIDKGANVNQVNPFGAETPLVRVFTNAQDNVDLELADYLLSRGADIGAAPKSEWSGMNLVSRHLNAVQCGLENASPQKLEFLLSRGCKPAFPGYYIEGIRENPESSILQDLVSRNLQPSYLGMLLQHGLDPNILLRDNRNAATEEVSLLYSTLLTYNENYMSDIPKAQKAREMAGMLLQKGATLRDSEWDVLLVTDILQWLPDSYLFAWLERNPTFRQELKYTPEPRIQRYWVIQLLSEVGNLLKNATTEVDYRAALIVCEDARRIAEGSCWTQTSTVRPEGPKGSPTFLGFSLVHVGDQAYVYQLNPAIPPLSERAPDAVPIQIGDILIDVEQFGTTENVTDLQGKLAVLKSGAAVTLTYKRPSDLRFPEVYYYCGLVEYTLGLKERAIVDFTQYLKEAGEGSSSAKAQVETILKGLL
jgi:ankyrin repeat protein